MRLLDGRLRRGHRPWGSGHFHGLGGISGGGQGALLTEGQEQPRSHSGGRRGRHGVYTICSAGHCGGQTYWAETTHNTRCCTMCCEHTIGGTYCACTMPHLFCTCLAVHLLVTFHFPPRSCQALLAADGRPHAWLLPSCVSLPWMRFPRFSFLPPGLMGLFCALSVTHDRICVPVCFPAAHAF